MLYNRFYVMLSLYNSQSKWDEKRITIIKQSIHPKVKLLQVNVCLSIPQEFNVLGLGLRLSGRALASHV